MSRKSTHKYAAYKIPNNNKINWKELVLDVLLRNRGRRFSTPQIRDLIMKLHPEKVKGFSKNELITRLSSSVVHLAKTKQIQIYPIRKETK